MQLTRPGENVCYLRDSRSIFPGTGRLFLIVVFAVQIKNCNNCVQCGHESRLFRALRFHNRRRYSHYTPLTRFVLIQAKPSDVYISMHVHTLSMYPPSGTFGVCTHKNHSFPKLGTGGSTSPSCLGKYIRFCLLGEYSHGFLRWYNTLCRDRRTSKNQMNAV